jgi:putative DNA primase/helicase
VESVRNRYEDAVGQAIILATMEEDRELDDKKGWICLDNGMFNIDTMETAPHGKHFLSTVQLPFSFDPDNPKPCPLWQKFLSETIQTENPIQQLQEFFGYCMTKEVRYETCLFMIGDGGDGKSTVQTLLRALCGKANCTSVPLDGLEDQFQRSALYKKLVNMSAEVGSNAMDSQFFKLIVSGDEISAAFKHKNTFDFEPFVKMVFAVNKMPKIMDNTDGFYRKILPISFKRQFLPGDPDRDPFLVDKLMEELPGIFGWAMAGLARLRQRGCFDVDCDETLQLVSEYRRQNSPIFAFVQDCLAIGETYTAGKEDLYKAYKAYCGENGYGASHRENFLADLRRTVKAVKNTRPRVNGERVQSLAGVGLVLKGSTL